MMRDLKEFLDQKVNQYNRPGFITLDPISIPHRFTKQQDIEISGFFAAILAWGQRKTIINKCLELFELMDHAPHDFILNHQEQIHQVHFHIPSLHIVLRMEENHLWLLAYRIQPLFDIALMGS